MTKEEQLYEIKELRDILFEYAYSSRYQTASWFRWHNKIKTLESIIKDLNEQIKRRNNGK